MSRPAPRVPAPRREGTRDAGARAPRLPRRVVGWLVAGLLALHVGLAIPGMLRSSIGYDENFHLPAGALYLARGYTHVSLGQPPLARALYALPVMLQRPSLPPDSILTLNAERAMAASFLQLNASRFQALYLSARVVALLMSLLVGFLVFRLGRELYGSSAGLLALAAWVAYPDAVSNAGLIGTDLPTALAYLLGVMALRAVVRRGGFVAHAGLALAVGAALLTRYSALQMAPVLAILAVWAALRRAGPGRWRPVVSLAVASVAGVGMIVLAYSGQVSWVPFGRHLFLSDGFHELARRVPWLVLPIPDAYVAGFDLLRKITEGSKPIFVLGRSLPESVWWYFPVAIAVKWPIGLLGLVALRAAWLTRRAPRRAWDEACLLLPAGVVFASAMLSDLAYGIRYLLPAVPFLCIWIGGLAARALRGARVPARVSARRWALAAVALVVLETAECALATPWQAAFYNAFARGRGEWIVNDTNVDWGQGLLALRDDMRRLGIGRIHLAYHGTTDPALYGIDYRPYTGGELGPESDWLAVSTYFWVGLPQRMVTPQGDTPWMQLDFRPLYGYPEVSRPGGCMRLVRIRQSGAISTTAR